MSHTEVFRITYWNEKMFLMDVDGNYYENTIVNDYSEGDIIEIEEDKVRLLYNGCEKHATIFITNHCNSGCIMCPDSDQYRSMETDYSLDHILRFASLLPEDIEGVDVTGGEPTLIKEELPIILHSVLDKRRYLPVMLLSNGRSFADVSYTEEFRCFAKRGLYVEIPIHGSTAKLHDTIVRVDGAYAQTMAGIRNLLSIGIQVGIRLVVTRLNYQDLQSIVALVATRFPAIRYINIMGMECLGNAYHNRDRVWIEFEEVKETVEETVKVCIQNGIEPRLFNFPLCLFKEKFWGCYRKSITPGKVRYMEECERCRVKEECGGFFYSTINVTQFKPERR